LKFSPFDFSSQLGSHFLRSPDILPLRRLISRAQKKDDGLAGLLEVDAVSRPKGYSHLADAGTDRLHITGIAKAEPLNAGSYCRLGFLIFQT
jgi:hypothetical protein